MKLQLKRPLVILDIESTGLDIAKDRIVEICLIKLFPDGKEEIKTLRVNPTIPISPQASSIHGITDNDVREYPTFKKQAKNIANFIEGCDLGGYNSTKFDIPLLAEEFLRAEVDVDFRSRNMIDVQNIFHRMEQRTLVAAYKFYCNKEIKNAHSAQDDTLATYEVLKAQLERYDDLEGNIEFLAEFSSNSKNVDYAGRMIYDEHGNELINFGKHKGKKVEEVLQVEPSYYDWIMKSEFTLDTKRMLTKIKLRTFGK
ncbi:MAG: exonuclease domain-containing protein [Bacteroidales bacterium]